MSLRRITRSVDGTIPVQALLYIDEEVYASQDNVGIYEGSQKSASHQAGTVVVTTHRLFYIDAQNPYKHSFSLDLSTVTQTDYYAGLFTSSPKITLHISCLSSASGQTVSNGGEGSLESWECEVCAYRNPPGLSPAAARICGLCGVPRASIPVPISSNIAAHRSNSLPASVAASVASELSTSSSPSLDDIDSNACPACTFLNHHSLKHCEMCSTELPRLPVRTSRTMKSAPSSRPSSPDPEDEDSTSVRFMKISFRKGGDKPFYTVLRRSLKGKMWESNGITSRPKSSDTSLASGRVVGGKSGITGILRTVESSAQGRKDGMLDALQDLEALSIKAKDMVRLAAELNEKLTAISAIPESQLLSSSIAPPEPEEVTFIRSSLSQLGLQMSNAPVTLDMMKDEKKWIEELARELAQVLQGSMPSNRGGGGMMKTRGMIALDEVWGGWNRARGVALIPPSTFLLVIPQLQFFTDPPIRMRTFSSGLNVLHTPPFTHASFSARLSGMLALTGPKTITEVSEEEGVTLGLAMEMIAAVEGDGHICRDDSASAMAGGGGGEVRWWANLFVGYTWDGQD
ncbi:hypothetical protein H0H92_013863 [Tricholoma furcatifolium]|nr:hypothetical protein H0H92_013863 [Tricholoma furcatifolium]